LQRLAIVIPPKKASTVVWKFRHMGKVWHLRALWHFLFTLLTAAGRHYPYTNRFCECLEALPVSSHL
jgi:hypothetical protein